MKKWIVCGTAVLLALATVACGKGTDEENGKDSVGTSSSQTQESTQGSTPESSGPQSDSQQPEGGETGESPLAYLKDAVVEVLGEDYWPNMEITADVLESVYGVTPDMYDAFFGEMPMISTNVDTLLIIRAKEDQVQAVEDALNAYREAQIENSMQYPMNVGKVQASRIEVVGGNYVCFAQLGADTTAEMDSGDEAVIDKCLEANEKAIDAIDKAIVE